MVLNLAIGAISTWNRKLVENERIEQAHVTRHLLHSPHLRLLIQYLRRGPPRSKTRRAHLNVVGAPAVSSTTFRWQPWCSPGDHQGPPECCRNRSLSTTFRCQPWCSPDHQGLHLNVLETAHLQSLYKIQVLALLFSQIFSTCLSFSVSASFTTKLEDAP